MFDELFDTLRAIFDTKDRQTWVDEDGNRHQQSLGDKVTENAIQATLFVPMAAFIAICVGPLYLFTKAAEFFDNENKP